jgi:hypothetical protein
MANYPSVADGSPNTVIILDYIYQALTGATPSTSPNKAEDSGHTSGDIGTFMLAVRNTGLASLTSSDFDYSPIAVSAKGEVYTQTVLTQSLPAGENHTGKVTGVSKNCAPTITTTAGAYSSGDCVGGLLTLTGASRSSNGTTTMVSAVIKDDANQKQPLTILVFDSDPSSGSTIIDSTAFAYGATAFSKQVAKINVSASDYETIDGKASADLPALGRLLTASGGSNLYAVVITTGTPTYGASSTALSMNIGFYQD